MFRHWPRRVRVGLAAAGATGLFLGGGLAAYAAVAPAPSINPIGSGGYDSVTTNPLGLTDGQEVVLPNQYSLTIATGNQGVKTCDSASGETAAVALHSTNLSTVFEAQWAVGTAACPVVTAPLAGTTFPNLANIPFGHHVWVHWEKVTRTRTIRILVCILSFKHDHKPVPTPSPTVALPTASPTVTPTVANPTASPSVSPTVNPLGGTQTENPVYGGPKGHKLPGDFIRCFVIKKHITKSFVILQAQDLDAPVATPVSGDLPGPQTVFAALPKGTVFNHNTLGATENTTSMTACSGIAADGHVYPLALAGPAAYTTGACQPANEQGYMTASVAGGPPQDPTVLTTTELISPNAAPGALVAPNNSLVATTPAGFPHSTDPDASTAGGHATLNLGNAPVG